MSKYVTKLDASGEVLLSQEWTDHDEKMDSGEMYHVTELEAAEVHARLLSYQMEEGETLHITDSPYEKPPIIEEKEITE